MTIRSTSYYVLHVTTALSLLSWAAPAFAAADAPAAAPEAAAEERGEIVVTARRRAESLEKVPVSVAALGSQQLREQSVYSQTDLQRTVPGLTIRQTSNANQFNYAIRGQSIDAFTGSRPAVVPYVNDVVLSSSGTSAFYDLESIQVLKGPQGTLFGRNATGGAVLYTTAKPKSDLSGFLTLRGGNYGLIEGQGALNLPIVSDVVALRLAGDVRRQRGYIKNDFLDLRLGGSRSYSGRASLEIKPGNGIENLTVFQYSHTKGRNTGIELYSAYPCGSSNNGIPLATTISCLYSPALDGIFGVPGAWQAFLDAHPGLPPGGLQEALENQKKKGPYHTDLDQPLFFRQTDYFVTNTTTVPLGDEISFKNILGYGHSKADTDSDYDGSPFPITINRAGSIDHVGSTYAFDNFTEEAQILGKAFDNNLDYILGVYYATERNTQYQPLLTVDLAPILAAGDASYVYRLHNRSTAVFAQATYNLRAITGSDRLSVTGGYRHTWETNRIRQLPGSIFFPTVGANPEQDKVNKPSWQVGLNYQATDTLLFYAVHRGSWRSGGYNGGAPPVNLVAAQGGNLFDPETTKDVEVGMKFGGRVFDRPAHFNIAAFDQKVDNIQRVIYAVINGNIAAVTGSVPSAKIKGFEADGAVSPVGWLTIGGSVSYVHARYTRPTATLFGQDFRFGPYADTPEWSGTVYGQLDFALPDIGDLSFRADVYAQTRQYFSNLDDTVSPGTRLRGYHLVNLRADLRNIAGSRFSIGAFATNLTKEKYYTGGLPLGAAFGLNSAVVGRPQMYGIEGSLNF